MLPEPAGVGELAVGVPANRASAGTGVTLARSGPASAQLLADLRSDKGMGWLPAESMWLSYLRIDSTAGELTHDLAVDVSGRASPSPVAAGLAVPASVTGTGTGGAGTDDPGPAAKAGPGWWPWPAAALVVTTALAGLVLARRGRSALR